MIWDFAMGVRGVGGDCAADAHVWASWPSAWGWFPRGDQRSALSCPFGARLADVADPLWSLAAGLRL